LPAVHIGPGNQEVHCPAQIDDELDLLVTILGGEGERVGTDAALLGAVEGRVDQDGQRPGAGQVDPGRQHAFLGVGQAVLDDDARERPLPFGDDHQCRHLSAFGAGVGDRLHGDAVQLPGRRQPGGEP
jgi:hypothetical protein